MTFLSLGIWLFVTVIMVMDSETIVMNVFSLLKQPTGMSMYYALNATTVHVALQHWYRFPLTNFRFGFPPTDWAVICLCVSINLYCA